jgi:hypothetical protein
MHRAFKFGSNEFSFSMSRERRDADIDPGFAESDREFAGMDQEFAAMDREFESLDENFDSAARHVGGEHVSSASRSYEIGPVHVDYSRETRRGVG